MNLDPGERGVAGPVGVAGKFTDLKLVFNCESICIGAPGLPGGQIVTLSFS